MRGEQSADLFPTKFECKMPCHTLLMPLCHSDCSRTYLSFRYSIETASRAWHACVSAPCLNCAAVHARGGRIKFKITPLHSSIYATSACVSVGADHSDLTVATQQQMANVSQAPALPWGASEASEQPITKIQMADSADDDLKAVSIDQLGLSIGDRIEVMWHLEQDEGASFERWWSAGIVAYEPSTSGNNQPVYKIKYDAWAEGGFPEQDEAHVTLMTEHRLVDVGQGAVMAWRREGEDYTPPDEQDSDEDEEEEEAVGGEATVTLQQLAASCDDASVAAADAEMLEALGAMEPAQQVQMAAGYRDFMDNFKQFVAAKAATASDEQGLLITAEDVETFKTMMMTQAATKGRLHRAT